MRAGYSDSQLSKLFGLFHGAQGLRGTGAQRKFPGSRAPGLPVPRTVRNRKGWLRIIEIALAATLVFSFMMFITRFEAGARVSRPETDRYMLQQLGEDALLSYDVMDSDSDHVTDLREEIFAGNWENIGEFLNGTLDSNVGYALYYYPSNASHSRDDVQFKTGWTVPPINRDIASVLYIIAGDDGDLCTGQGACALKLEVWYIR
ncbi:MAG: hypothetical protein ABIF92_03265 [archaeon]